MNFTATAIVDILADLIEDNSGVSEFSNMRNEFLSLSNDSGKVEKHSVFVAITGAVSNGHDFIADAIAKGAELIVHQQCIKKENGLLYLQVADSYSAYARLAELACGFPGREMKLIGITGTNGKTTTSYLLRSILEHAGEKCGLISTVEYACPGITIQAERTTPDALEFQHLLCKFRKAGCEYVVMELSSHALDQNRTGSAKFATAVFTNLSGDHLDYHHSMESYFLAKKQLFQYFLADNAKAVVNIDDSYGERLAGELTPQRESLTFGRAGGADFKISDIRTSPTGTEVILNTEKEKQTFSSRLYGKFNAYNITAAVTAAYGLGIDTNAIHCGIEKMQSVPGRMEGFYMHSGAYAIVDYAHTDDAMKNVMKTLRETNGSGELTVVFGCGGDRDKTKRPRMGAVAARFADKVIVTSDNPRSEDPKNIIKDILTGIPASSNLVVIPDRKSAIIEALSSCKTEGVVLVAGKGDESYQEINGIKHSFDDREVIKEYIEKCL